MSKKPKTDSQRRNTSHAGFVFEKKYKDIYQYKLASNGLTVLYKCVQKTGVVTSNITYKVGSKDEARGETGLAHMLEHMLFKPTKQDLQKKIDSRAMEFERSTGCTLNANTWKDRTTYFFSYPQHYFEEALSIEAERMFDVVLTDKEFLPERGNVLSEFDMNNGDPHFALSVQMVCNAFHSHSYGHETIGFREDIERYTPEKLDAFYKRYYRPDNATLTIVGDIAIQTALAGIKKYFGKLQTPKTPIPRFAIAEPKQEGLRRAYVERPSSSNSVFIGIKHDGFPNVAWFETAVLLDILTDGQDSILHTALVDTGLATEVDAMLEPTKDINLGMITITLARNAKHTAVEEKVLSILENLSQEQLQKHLQNVIASTITAELFARGSSLKIAMELTEYIAADAVDTYYKTEAILRTITSKKLKQRAQLLFTPSNMTIGHFIGT